MSKQTILIIASALVLIIVAGAAFYILRTQFLRTQSASPAPAQTSFGTNNPLEKAPDLNPTTKTNPFTKVNTNPFQ